MTEVASSGQHPGDPRLLADIIETAARWLRDAKKGDIRWFNSFGSIKCVYSQTGGTHHDPST